MGLQHIFVVLLQFVNDQKMYVQLLLHRSPTRISRCYTFFFVQRRFKNSRQIRGECDIPSIKRIMRLNCKNKSIKCDGAALCCFSFHLHRPHWSIEFRFDSTECKHEIDRVGVWQRRFHLFDSRVNLVTAAYVASLTFCIICSTIIGTFDTFKNRSQQWNSFEWKTVLAIFWAHQTQGH